ncbi:MAG: hypothetical protein ACI82Z_000910 [Cellvibrionaceae bacterium]|jgi:hypothetical protein
MNLDQSIERHQDVVTNYIYLGLLPFFGSALGPWIFPSWESWFTDVFFFYSTLILAFLAGSLWAVALFTKAVRQSRHIHMAIVLSLWPLLAYLLPKLIGLSLMIAGFLLLLFWEKCFINSFYPAWYQKLRHNISFIVIACHMLTIWNLIRVD